MELYKSLFLLKSYFLNLFFESINFLIFFLTDFIYLYKLLCNARIMLKWFPALGIESNVYLIITYLTDPYFNFWKSLFKPVMLSNVYMSPLPLIYINFINYFFYFIINILKAIYKLKLANKKIL